jgi:hypothetical protein
MLGRCTSKYSAVGQRPTALLARMSNLVVEPTRELTLAARLTFNFVTRYFDGTYRSYW